MELLALVIYCAVGAYLALSIVDLHSGVSDRYSGSLGVAIFVAWPLVILMIYISGMTTSNKKEEVQECDYYNQRSTWRPL